MGNSNTQLTLYSNVKWDTTNVVILRNSGYDKKRPQQRPFPHWKIIDRTGSTPVSLLNLVPTQNTHLIYRQCHLPGAQ